jgi:hypothetical protein
MNPNVIVLVTMLVLPEGESSVHVKPFETIAACQEAAEIERTDPFVARAGCSSLTNGVLKLEFKKHDAAPDVSPSSITAPAPRQRAAKLRAKV